MPFAIDLDRGVTIKRHPEGFNVFMYKDAPGVYFNGTGHEVSDVIAERAGFDTLKFRTEKMRRKAVEDAIQAVNAKFGVEPGTIIHENAGFKVKHLGGGMFQVVDPDGLAMTDNPLNKEAAINLCDQLVVADQTAKEQAEPVKKGK